LNGYVSGILISKRNLPPSYGVSGGPMISPRRCVYVSFMSSTLMLQAWTCHNNKHWRWPEVIM
jgi:hypothetical protein